MFAIFTTDADRCFTQSYVFINMLVRSSAESRQLLNLAKKRPLVAAVKDNLRALNKDFDGIIFYVETAT